MTNGGLTILFPSMSLWKKNPCTNLINNDDLKKKNDKREIPCHFISSRIKRGGIPCHFISSKMNRGNTLSFYSGSRMTHNQT